MTPLTRIGSRGLTRAECVVEAQRLRAEGLKLREIADVMGTKLKTVHTWLSDPDLSRQRARRRRYAAPCSVCGGPTNGSGGYKTQVEICTSCRAVPDEEYIADLRAFHAVHGRSPLRVDISRGTQMEKRFGSWNNALRAAGLEINMIDKTVEVAAQRRRLAADLHRAGHGLAEIAEICDYASPASAAMAIQAMRRQGVDIPWRGGQRPVAALSDAKGNGA